MLFVVLFAMPQFCLASESVSQIVQNFEKTTMTYCENERETQCYSLKYSTADRAVYQSKILKENIRLAVKGAQLKKLEVVFLSLTEVFQAELYRQQARRDKSQPCSSKKILSIDSPENLTSFEMCWSWAGSEVRKQVKALRKKLEKMATRPSKAD